jgi:hypothetical protein
MNFNIVTRQAGVDTIVGNGSFNGNLGTRVLLDTNYHIYEIQYNQQISYFFIDGVLLHTSFAKISTFVANTSVPVSLSNTNSSGQTTNVSLNAKELAVFRYGQTPGSNNDPLYVTISAPSGSLNDIAIGKILMGGAVSNTKNAIRRTVYTEQTTGAQRSLASSSANDTAAGTGARQVTITYCNSTLTVRKTETVTLNGTAAVATVNTDICFIEKIVVTSVGSNGSNVGTISLFVNNAGGGGTISTIPVDVSGTVVGIANRTYYAHHYVLSGKTCTVATFDSGTQGNANAEAFLSAVDPTNPNSPDVQVSDSITVGLNSGTTPRSVPNTIKVLGPARITMYLIPAGNNTAYFGSFDFFEQ